MPARTLLALLLVALAVNPASARPGSYAAVPSPPDAPRFVRLESVSGLPRAAAERDPVDAALRAQLVAAAFPLEGAGACANRFRPWDGPPADTVWSASLVFGFPRELPAKKLAPKSGTSESPASSRFARGTRAAHGMTLVVELQSPESRFRGDAATSQRFDVVFPPDSTNAFPWEDAGRAAGVLVLEVLHRANGDLSASQHAALGAATRMEPMGR